MSLDPVETVFAVAANTALTSGSTIIFVIALVNTPVVWPLFTTSFTG